MGNKYEKWQDSSNTYRDKPTKDNLKKAYDAFDSYKEEGIKEANKLTPEQAAAKKAYLAGVAAEKAGVKEIEKTNPMGDTFKKGGKVSSASKRADGCAIRGKTKA
jgi:uncharacterized protein YxeA